MTGDTVNGNYQYPTVGRDDQDFGTATVRAGVEFGYASRLSFDFSDAADRAGYCDGLGRHPWGAAFFMSAVGVGWRAWWNRCRVWRQPMRRPGARREMKHQHDAGRLTPQPG